MTGRYTRQGDVRELLLRSDDMFVVSRPGDQISLSFNASALPPLPAGWTRSFVLRTWGYCKDATPFTTTGGTIEPLPFRAMSGFPYGPGEAHPHPEYVRTWNTRQVGIAEP